MSKQTVLGLLIPRPLSFLVNSVLFGGGVLIAWLEGYRGQPSSSQVEMPSWLFIILWFLIQEVLVQQAKYMWNDIRDHERDQKIPANRIRPISQQLLSANTTIVMVGRWIIGLGLAWLLSPVLLTVVLLISGLQIVYEFVAKPHADAQPVLSLYVVSAGAVLKSISGALVIGYPPGDQRMWIYGLVLFATGVVYASSFWRSEAVYFVREGLIFPRGQSPYFAQWGMEWLRVGKVVTFGSCAVLIMDGYATFLVQVDIPTGLAFCLIITAGVICCRAFYSMIHRKIESINVVLVLNIIAGASFYLFQIEDSFLNVNEIIAPVLLLIVLLINHQLNASIDYKQHNLLYLIENWPKLRKAANELQFQSSPLMRWRQLLQLTLVLNNAKFEKYRAGQK